MKSMLAVVILASAGIAPPAAAVCAPPTPHYSFQHARGVDGKAMDESCGEIPCTLRAYVPDLHHYTTTIYGQTSDDERLRMHVTRADDTGLASRLGPSRPWALGLFVWWPILGACAPDRIVDHCADPDLVPTDYDVWAVEPDTSPLVDQLVGAKVYADNDRLEITWGDEGNETVFVYLRIEDP